MLTAVWDYLTLDHAGAASIGGVLAFVMKYLGTSGLTAIEGAASFIGSVNTVAQTISAQATAAAVAKATPPAPVSAMPAPILAVPK
jgi:hypothetical protein